MTEPSAPRAPSLGEALIPLLAIALFLSVGYAYLGWRIEVMLLAAGAVAGAVGWRLGYAWKDMEAGIIEALGKGLPAIMITDTAPFRYPFYHLEDDTPDRLDYARMARVVDGLAAVIAELAG